MKPKKRTEIAELSKKEESRQKERKRKRRTEEGNWKTKATRAEQKRGDGLIGEDGERPDGKGEKTQKSDEKENSRKKKTEKGRRFHEKSQSSDQIRQVYAERK